MLASAASTALLFPLAGKAQLTELGDGHLKCWEGRFEIDAPSAALAGEICTVLVEATQEMAFCGLKQTRPISVEVVDSVTHPFGDCLASFDCESNVIKVTNPTAFEKLLEPENPYLTLPSEVLLKALLTHELAHGLTAQTAGDRQVDIVDQEYIAAAFELELLGEKWREVLMAASPVSLPPSTGMVDIWIYSLAPRKFATNAWRHFHLEGNGCGLVEKIVSGDYSFAGHK